MSKEKEYYEYLLGIMLSTRGCRFTAASTLSVKDKWSVGTVAVLSCYMLGWSLVGFAYPEIITENNAKFFSTVSTLSSLSLLVISLMDFAYGRSIRADKLRENALEITSLMRELERELVSLAPNSNNMQRIASEYETINKKTQISHSAIDRVRWIFSRAKSKNAIFTLILRLRYLFIEFIYYFISMFFHIVISALALMATIAYVLTYVNFHKLH